MSLDSVEVARKLFYQSIECLEKEDWAQAESYLRAALQHEPDRPSLLNNLSVALLKLGKFDEAEQVIARVLSIEPDAPEGWANRGELCNELKQHRTALENFDKAIALKPDYGEAWSNRGIALNDLKQHEAAVESCDHAIKLNPDLADAWLNRGNALNDLQRHQAALESYDRAITLKPEAAAIYLNRGHALIKLGRHADAIIDIERAISLKRDYAEAYFGLGNAQMALGRHQAALENYEKSIAIKPDYVEAGLNRSSALDELRRYREAIDSYQNVMRLSPGHDFLHGTLLHAKIKICDWSDFQNDVDHIKRIIEKRGKATGTFSLLSFLDAPEVHRQASEIWVENRFPANAALGPIAKRPRNSRIRIGYYSADFRNHAVAHLVAGLFDAHDRGRFELFAFSFGPPSNDETRQRIAKAFDQFIDVSHFSDRHVAQMSREMQVDIAVDLLGYTEFSRTGIFALRAAPIQINYLGYPGTMGASYIDYLIADKVVIAANNRQHYAEKIAYLPHSYQANDDKRQETEETVTRKALGLPETGFVFCCFNNNFKITPGTFDSWMRILHAVEGSVLWLLKDNSDAVDNLRKEARLRGIDGERLVFAERMSRSKHLARHRAADLFLDTLPYNAHTTASDALWVGLPLLTCMGQAFAGRVAASLLRAMNLPELITATKEEFEDRAIHLAKTPAQLLEIKQRLIRNRRSTPLFDTALFARHIEAAYIAMYERYHADLPPDDIRVPG